MRGARAALLAVGLALAGCATPSPEAGESEAAGDMTGGGVARARLQPLASALAVPPGMAPRSQVPRVNYDITASDATDLPFDDGVPGDVAPRGPREVLERGGASWYGIQFHQKKTANGERFDMTAMTAAHKTLPFGTRVCVRSLVNGKQVLVRINDRGPYAQGRIIDLSRAAADQIGLTTLGIKQVALSVIDRNDQRCGTVAGDMLASEPAREAAPGVGTGNNRRSGKPAVHPRQRR